jgi:RNA polymerase sigma-70 factor (ECF subfamily)
MTCEALSARDAVLSRNFALLWRYFRTRTDHDVDDLIQQTFMLYLESADEAGSIRHPQAYLLRIARSVLFRHYRRVRSFDPLTHTVEDRTGRLSSLVARRERDAELHSAITALPYQLFEVVDLYYGEGIRGPALAAALGVPQGTIRSRLRRAKTQLRRACAPHGENLHSAPRDRKPT